MKRLLPTSLGLALLASIATPAEAQAQTTWSGTYLSIAGNRSNGCDLRVVDVTHAGSTLNSMRFAVANRAMASVRATVEVTLTGNNQRKSGTISGVIGAGQMATLQGFYPFGGLLVGSTVALRFLGCTPA